MIRNNKKILVIIIAFFTISIRVYSQKIYTKWKVETYKVILNNYKSDSTIFREDSQMCVNAIIDLKDRAINETLNNCYFNFCEKIKLARKHSKDYMYGNDLTIRGKKILFSRTNLSNKIKVYESNCLADFGHENIIFILIDKKTLLIYRFADYIICKKVR